MNRPVTTTHQTKNPSPHHLKKIQVVAKPDDKWGEVPCAFVSLKDGHELTEVELIAFARENLAHYKVPFWIFVFVFGFVFGWICLRASDNKMRPASIHHFSIYPFIDQSTNQNPTK